ncbi:hypothetical protein R2Q81_05350 [Microbacterium aquimaris]|uniref:hypothetical protein n=1 Tax=Microbacterium aquimaris TaxID=459816 RepID=UPI002AD263DA|nr:hypothetical protein [Microbacterium aquimaris]MDZ8275378.1 hypothetical protein [Microbacterium aquimaris]
MHTIVKRALWGALIGGGISLLGAGVAQAAETSGEDGLLSGTQALVDVDAPITVSGNAISVLGDSHSEGADTQAPAPAPAPEASTSGSDGAASGSQAIITVEVPITVSGNAISVAGDSQSDGAQTSSSGASEPAPEASTSGEDSVAGGTQGVVSVEAPVTVGGNAISVLGDGESTDASTGHGGSGNGGDDTAANTSGDDSVAGGTQVVVPVEAPVTVAGNAISAIGDSQSTDATTGTNGGHGGETTGTTNGDDSLLGGTQVVAPVEAPVTVGGNAISAIGDSTSADATTGNSGGHGSETTGTTNGDDSLLGGTQVIAPIEAPVTVGGNAISAIGDSESTNATTGNGGGSNGGDTTTGGSDSILGGTQVLLPISLPITIGGNAISVIGDSETTSPTTPGVPGDPTEPTDPRTPTDPDTPTGPTTPSTPVTPASSGSPVSVSAMPASTGTTAILAATGGDVAGWTAGLGLLMLVAGLVLAHRRASIG